MPRFEVLKMPLSPTAQTSRGFYEHAHDGNVVHLATDQVSSIGPFRSLLRRFSRLLRERRVVLGITRVPERQRRDGLGALFGVALVLGAKLIRVFLKRDEDYYDRDG